MNPPPRLSKIQAAPATTKIPPTTTNRTVAQVAAPAATVGQAQTKYDASTYLTRVGGTLVLYNGDRTWAKVTLTLRTAGPVAVGQSAELQPVLSGKGQLLQTGVPAFFNVAKGDRLYVASTSVNAIGVLVEGYPWLETITGLIGGLAGVTPLVIGKVG